MKPVALLILCSLLLAGCIRLKTEPIQVEPIHITMDINLRIAKELDEFFGDLDAQSQVLDETKITNQPH